MRIDGYTPPLTPGAISRPAGTITRNAELARPQAPTPSQESGKASAATTDRAITVEAPPGTDPELWSILTAEERAFFSSTVTRGPLTYLKVMSPNRTPMPPVTRGGRLDVRG